jgi:very-short-patch-repair endonuclease
MTEQQKLTARFNAIRAHYAKFSGRFIHRNRWDIDAYAWDDYRSGIRMSPIEHALWCDIRNANAVFYPQFPAGIYFLDFANPAAKVGIECDGRQWHQDEERDRARQARLEHMGWTIYRISGRDCLRDTTELEREHGGIDVCLSPAYLFIKKIADRHGLCRCVYSEDDDDISMPRHMSDVIDDVYRDLLERAKCR